MSLRMFSRQRLGHKVLSANTYKGFLSRTSSVKYQQSPTPCDLRYLKISALLAGLEDLLKKNKAQVVKHGQSKLVLTAEQHQLPLEKISINAIRAIQRLQSAGYQAYLVGGGVRDLLLDKNPKDFDVSTNATPDQVRALFHNACIIGRRFRIVHINYGNEIIEVTTFRQANAKQLHVSNAISREGKKYAVQVNSTGMLVRDNNYGTRIEEDAQRRDFTINAIYFNPESGELLDFHGGLYDLTHGIIDIIGDPTVRYQEDPVRIIRAARFSAKLGFKISKRTLDPIKKCSRLLMTVPSARMYDEVNKLFLTGHAQASFHVLLALDLFDQLFTIDKQILNSSMCRDFLDYAFHSTDQRVKDGRRNMPHFLYAIVLWNTFIWHFYKTRSMYMLISMPQDKESNSISTIINNLAVQVILKQFQKTALPEQIISSIVCLWRLQFTLESKTPQKYVESTRHQSAFRAAFDLFKLRAHFDPHLQESIDFWSVYYEESRREVEARQEARKMRDAKRSERRGSHKNHKDSRSSRNNRNENERIYEKAERRSESREVDFNTREPASQRVDTMNKARAWRESMNLEP